LKQEIFGKFSLPDFPRWLLAHLFHADVMDHFAGKFAWVLGG